MQCRSRKARAYQPTQTFKKPTHQCACADDPVLTKESHHCTQPSDLDELSIDQGLNCPRCGSKRLYKDGARAISDIEIAWSF